MQVQNVPATGRRYWAALCLASIFGCNMGDFVARILHLGHSNGLLPLALVFAAILLAERRLRMATEAYYWLAIVTLRTAATNIGDLLKHDWHLGFVPVMAALLVLLVVVLIAEQYAPKRREQDAFATRTRGLPVTNLYYWGAMLTAGALGTVAGDYVADVLEFGEGWGSVLLGAVLAACFVARGIAGLSGIAMYWVTVVAVRAAGTTAGDFLASRHGLALGLPVSTAVTALALLALLLAWPRTALQPAAG